MDIAGTISKYRKVKNLTQEALGELVGVTNQAVSKWENGTSSPDISIIPALAEALGISLEQFFGVRDDSQPERVSADDLPEEAFKRLYHTFSELWKLSPLAEAKETWLKAWRLSCVSNTHGCMTAAAGPFAFIDLSFKTPNGGEIFENDYTARAVSKLFQKSVRKVLEYEYNFTVARNDYQATSVTPRRRYVRRPGFRGKKFWTRSTLLSRLKLTVRTAEGCITLSSVIFPISLHCFSRQSSPRVRITGTV